MRILAGAVLFLRFLQTAAYIGLFFFSLIKVREPKKKRIAVTVALYLVITVAFFGIAYTFGQQTAEVLIIPVEILLCLILISICSADRWPVTLFIMFTQFNLLLGISYVSDLLTFGGSDFAYQIQYFIYRTVLFGALLFFNFKFLRPRFRRLVDVLTNEWRFIVPAAFSFYILEAFILYYPQMYWHEPGNRLYLVASSYLVFFCVYGLVFWSIGAIVQKYQVQERENVLALQNKMWEEQIEEQKEDINATRRDRHDLRHHYDTLLSMLQSGKIQEALSYLTTQTRKMEGTVLSGICEHTAANVILSRWKARAEEKGIRTEIDAKIPGDLPMDEVALVGILANAFENAVEGCLRCEDGRERSITVKIAYTLHDGGGKLRIVFENSCADDLVFENGMPVSQKSGGGTGTKSILYTAERYHGMVEFTATESVFWTRILLHLS